MKKHIFLLLLFLGSSTLILAQQPPPLPPKKNVNSGTQVLGVEQKEIRDLKIAFVYTDSVINNYDFFKEKSEEITEKGKKLDLDLQTRAKVFEEELAMFQKTGGSLSENQIRAKQDELMQKEQNLISYRDKLMKELSEDESKLLNIVYDQVQEYMKEYAEKNDIDLILSYTRGGAIWFAIDAMDVTKSVIERLNWKYEGYPPAAPISENSRINDIRNWYSEIQSIGMKNCTTKAYTVYEDFGGNETPYGQTIQRCKLSPTYTLLNGDFSGHEWAENVKVYLKNDKIFFVIITAGDDGGNSEIRYYCNEDEKIIKELWRSADLGEELTGPNSEDLTNLSMDIRSIINFNRFNRIQL
jgi:outer membrane protein